MRTRAARGDRGAVAVEAAIILPLLFLLIFGMLEIGSALKSYSGASNAVRAGGRMASVAANDADADQQILERMAGEATGISAGEIQYIVIWHASANGERPPPACLPAAQGAPNTSSVGVSDGGPAVNAVGACNIYHRPADTGGAFDLATGKGPNPAAFYFGCSSPAQGTTKLDCNWPGRDRKVTVTPRTAPTPPSGQRSPDYLGVYIKAEHDYVTGVLGDTLTITDASVNLLEPQGYSVTT
jgi:hypothetical protein